MLQKNSKKGYITAIEGVEQKTLVYGEKTLMTEFLLKKGHQLPLPTPTNRQVIL